MNNIIKTVTNFFADALFPKKCLGCKKFDTWLCGTCHKNLPLLTEQKCTYCNKTITPNGQTCLTCASNPENLLSGVFVVSTYDSQLLRDAIHHMKYKFIPEICDDLSLLLAQGLYNAHIPTPDVVIPVPLHKQRLRWRGFNQSELLAKSLGLDIPLLTDVLLRKRNTKSQVKVRSKQKRHSNLRDAFAVENSDQIKGKSILLIDDVITTGATLTECAKTLIEAGASDVTALVLTRE